MKTLTALLTLAALISGVAAGFWAGAVSHAAPAIVLADAASEGAAPDSPDSPLDDSPASEEKSAKESSVQDLQAITVRTLMLEPPSLLARFHYSAPGLRGTTRLQPDRPPSPA